MDFEFTQHPGHHPLPICMVAREVMTGRLLRFDKAQLHALTAPPFPVDESALVFAYYASAECSCFLALSWSLPVHLVDLYAEFRIRTNGGFAPSGNGLIGALVYFGLPTIADGEKNSMRQIAIRGGPFTPDEMHALLDYCQSDVDALTRLWPAMVDALQWPQALLRGRYMKACARMEWTGIPIDANLYEQIRSSRDELKQHLILSTDSHHRVFDGLAFRRDRWLQWCGAQGIPWPFLPSGAPNLSEAAFKQQEHLYPIVAPFRELRKSLVSLRAPNLAIGPDHRNRTLLSAFSTITGRNSPRNGVFIFGYPAWMRSLIRPEPGMGLAYIDWSQQEFGIGAALSGDDQMMMAYTSGDPYLAFAKMAGAAPAEATKDSHESVRDRFKVCALAVQYRQEAQSLAESIAVFTERSRSLGVLPGGCTAEGEILLDQHKRAFPTYWKWSDAVIMTGELTRSIRSSFGWRMSVSNTTKWRTIANFAGQANGADMLRLACVRATENGVVICSPIHDAILIQAPVEKLTAAIATTQDSMAWASRQVLGGFSLRSDVKTIIWPDRYIDKRGQRTWSIVEAFLTRRA